MLKRCSEKLPILYLLHIIAEGLVFSLLIIIILSGNLSLCLRDSWCRVGSGKIIGSHVFVLFTLFRLFLVFCCCWHFELLVTLRRSVVLNGNRMLAASFQLADEYVTQSKIWKTQYFKPKFEMHFYSEHDEIGTDQHLKKRFGEAQRSKL